MRFPAEGEPAWIADPGWQPPPATAEQLAAARTAIAAYEAWLRPADPQWLARRCNALMARFWVGEFDEETCAYQLADTIEALARWPQWAIQDACRWWIAGQSRRPDAASLVRRCRELVAAAPLELAALRRLVDPAEQARAIECSTAERQRRADIAAAAERKREAEAKAAAWRREHPRGDWHPPKAIARAEDDVSGRPRPTRAVLAECAGRVLPAEDDPRVRRFLDAMQEAA
jgi:hypothetical protein